jgi:Predicted glycosyltransferase involved in capsule biosynthesis
MSERNTEQQAPIRAWLSCRVDGELVSAKQGFPATRAEVEDSLTRAGIAPDRLPEAVVTVQDTDIPALAGRLPRNPGLDELNHLAHQIDDMEEEERLTFSGAVEVNLHCDSMAELINLTYNLDAFDLYPGSFSEKEFGEIYSGMESERFVEIVKGFEASEDSEERAFATYLDRLEGNLDLEGYARQVLQEERSFLTSGGYLLPSENMLPEMYSGPQDIPSEHRLTTPIETPERRPSLLAALKAAKAQSKAAQTERPDTPERKTPSGPEL